MNDVRHGIDRQGRSAMRQQIERVREKLLDAVERQLDALASPPVPARSSAIARRQLANMLQLWQFCAGRKCRRARCCRGEPADCIRYALPLLPPDELIRLLAPRGRASAHRVRRGIAPTRPAHFAPARSALASPGDSRRA